MLASSHGLGDFPLLLHSGRLKEYAGLVQATKGAVSSCVQQPCHIQRTVVHRTPPCPPALTFFLPLLPKRSLSLDGLGGWSRWPFRAEPIEGEFGEGRENLEEGNGAGYDRISLYTCVKS